MPSFRQGEIIQVPFPYTDRATRQRRPALVVSSGDFEDQHGLLWVVMITSSENRGWPSDIPVPDHISAGLPEPSVVRPAKIATVEVRAAEPLGVAPGELSRRVLETVWLHVAFAKLPRARPSS